jgi:hypothetical protein
MSAPHPQTRTKRPVSAARLEANRRNARLSTGPKTPEGKAASRKNAVSHGFRCEVVEPEDQLPLIEARAERWIDQFEPDDDLQAWHVRRAAAISVRLDLCLEAEIDARKAGAKRAARRFETAERAKIRRLAGQIDQDPIGVVTTLESSGYGLDWLTAELRGMAGDLEDSDGYLGEVERRRALAMLGINPKSPSVNHEHPVAGPFMRAALGNDPDHPPDEGDRWTGLDLRGIPDHARRVEHAKHLPAMEDGRRHCLAVLLARLEELEAVRDEVYAEVDAPRLAEARRRGGAIGGTKKAHTLRRYESALSLDMTRAMSALSKLRRDAERRPIRHDPADFEPPADLADLAESLEGPESPEPSPAPECQPTVTPAPAPNEPNAGRIDSPNPLPSQDFREPTPTPSFAHRPAPTRPPAVAPDASPHDAPPSPTPEPSPEPSPRPDESVEPAGEAS